MVGLYQVVHVTHNQLVLLVERPQRDLVVLEATFARASVSPPLEKHYARASSTKLTAEVMTHSTSASWSSPILVLPHKVLDTSYRYRTRSSVSLVPFLAYAHLDMTAIYMLYCAYDDAIDDEHKHDQDLAILTKTTAMTMTMIKAPSATRQRRRFVTLSRVHRPPHSHPRPLSNAPAAPDHNDDDTGKFHGDEDEDEVDAFHGNNPFEYQLSANVSLALMQYCHPQDLPTVLFQVIPRQTRVHPPDNLYVLYPRYPKKYHYNLARHRQDHM